MLFNYEHSHDSTKRVFVASEERESGTNKRLSSLLQGRKRIHAKKTSHKQHGAAGRLDDTRDI